MKYLQLFLGIYLIAIIFYLLHFLIVGKAVYGDGRYYYSYLPTLFIQHTLNFTKSYTYYGISGFITPKHTFGNIYSIGPATFWIIPYIVFYSFLSLLGNSNAYDILIQIFVGIWNVSAVCFALFILWLTLRKYFSKEIAFFAISTTFFTTNLFFYGSLDVINSHSAGFFFSVLLLYLITKNPTHLYSFLEGCLVGILGLIRIQDSMFLLLPLIQLINIFNNKKQFFSLYLLTTAGFLLFLTPQLLLWGAMWGNFLKSPYLYQQGFHFLHPHIFDVLFGIHSGLFLWTPSVMIAFLGLFFFLKKEKTLTISFFVLFILELYLIASWNVWWEGASYSARMFITTLPILSFGFAASLEKIHKFQRLAYLIIFTSINCFSIVYFLLYMK